METATFVVAIAALLLSGWAAWSTHRQAKATERATQAAEHSATAAAETLATAQKMERYEAIRLHAERRPEISLDSRRLKDTRNGQVRGIRLVNHGPIRYDEWEISVDLRDAETAKLLTGLLDEDEQVCSSVTVADVDQGEVVDLEVGRVLPQVTGDAKFVVLARSGEDEWRVVLHLPYRRPGRIITAP
ncbi:hypothetical protein ACFX43_04345 [Nocardioides sp. YIM B13467]|uniref:hypothetical protein n=1 Tax=Nocardioides sp. YIM B13467 TaxID=3366294 RepID=UPI00366BA3E5